MSTSDQDSGFSTVSSQTPIEVHSSYQSSNTTEAATTAMATSPYTLDHLSTLIMGSVVGAMLFLTIALCIKTRIVKKRDNKTADHLEHVNIDHQHNGEFETNEMGENRPRDREGYALVEPNEKCYVDLPPGEYDLLRSQRQHKTCSSKPPEESSYDQFQKASSLYDIAGQVHKDVVLTDNEYEMVKNMKKTNTLNKESVGLTK